MTASKFLLAWAIFLTLAVFGGWRHAAAERPLASGSASEAPAGARLREGALLVNQPGTFQLLGERYVFVLQDDSRQLAVLENLALERVARVEGKNPAAQAWLVSGTITEFQGNNFLLVQRAVVQRAVSGRNARR